MHKMFISGLWRSKKDGSEWALGKMTAIIWEKFNISVSCQSSPMSFLLVPRMAHWYTIPNLAITR